MASSRFVVGVTLHSALLAGTLVAVLHLLATGRFYATALLLSAIALLIVFSLARYVAKVDRTLESFVDVVAATEFQHSLSTPTDFSAVSGALERAVSELRLAKAASQQQLDHLRGLLDNVAVALLYVDEAGTVTLVNRAAQKLVGQPVRRVADLAGIGPDLAKFLAQGQSGQRSILRLRSGQRVLASIAGFSAGASQSRLMSVNNVEVELDAVELKAWRDLVRVLAHEIMNSLTPVSSLAAGLRQLFASLTATADPSGVQQLASDITSSMDAIERRSAGLMSFVARYRKVAELPRPVLRETNARELLNRIGQLMASSIAAENITFMVTVDPPELSMMVDTELFEQVLINLVHNSIDAAKSRDHGRIELCARAHEAGVVITVADNGAGLDESVAERIFMPFFTTKRGGSGIGLSFARQVVTAHGGQIAAATNVPNGAVFTITLPPPVRSSSNAGVICNSDETT
jgi:two-component system nitrogen regulation sensor histidine kinase NtrY